MCWMRYRFWPVSLRASKAKSPSTRTVLKEPDNELAPTRKLVTSLPLVARPLSVRVSHLPFGERPAAGPWYPRLGSAKVGGMAVWASVRPEAGSRAVSRPDPASEGTVEERDQSGAGGPRG